jgi:hypothetical protein
LREKLKAVIADEQHIFARNQEILDSLNKTQALISGQDVQVVKSDSVLRRAKVCITEFTLLFGLGNVF